MCIKVQIKDRLPKKSNIKSDCSSSVHIIIKGQEEGKGKTIILKNQGRHTQLQNPSL